MILAQQDIGSDSAICLLAESTRGVFDEVHSILLEELQVLSRHSNKDPGFQVTRPWVFSYGNGSGCHLLSYCHTDYRHEPDSATGKGWRRLGERTVDLCSLPRTVWLGVNSASNRAYSGIEMDDVAYRWKTPPELQIPSGEHEMLIITIPRTATRPPVVRFVKLSQEVQGFLNKTWEMPITKYYPYV